MLTILMLISHVISDFIMQTKDIVELKSNLKLKGFLQHGLGLTFTSIPILLFITHDSLVKLLTCIAGIILIHLALDFGKEAIQRYAKTKNVSGKWYAIAFVIDQILHIIVIIWLTHSIELSLNSLNRWISDVLLFGNAVTYDNLKAIFIIIYVSFSGAYFIPLIFDIVYEKINKYTDVLNDILKDEENRKAHAFIDEAKTGKWIGILERILILVFLFLNEFSAIGFIIAIKSLARFKLMENKVFSEYYLLGTLLSLVYTMIGFNLFNYLL